MKQLPVPTFALSRRRLPRVALDKGAPASSSLQPAQAESGGLTIAWEHHLDEVREAQRLRYDVFAGEMGARLSTSLAEFMARNQLDTLIGCASIPILHNGVISGDAVAIIWRQVSSTHLAPIEYQVFPRLALLVDQLDDSLYIEPPALIRGYLRMGAKVLGPTTWDPDLKSADLPMFMRMLDRPSRYRRHFLGER